MSKINNIHTYSDENRVGPYDGLCIRTEAKKYPNSFINLNNNKLYNGNQNVLFGSQVPVDNVLSQPLTNSNFIFSNNMSSLNCCPATYSTSTGCICSTNQDQQNINTRGGNRTFPNGF